MKATRSESTFTLTGKHWSGTYPLDDLPKWLAFYRRLRENHPKSGTSYDATIEALEGLERELVQPKNWRILRLAPSDPPLKRRTSATRPQIGQDGDDAHAHATREVEPLRNCIPHKGHSDGGRDLPDQKPAEGAAPPGPHLIRMVHDAAGCGSNQRRGGPAQKRVQLVDQAGSGGCDQGDLLSMKTALRRPDCTMR